MCGNSLHCSALEAMAVTEVCELSPVSGAVSKVLITDSCCSANRGDAAILTSLLLSLEDELGPVKFKVHSTYPHLTKMMHGVEANFTLAHDLPVDNKRQLANFLIMAMVFLAFALLYRIGIDLSALLGQTKRESFLDFCRANLVVGMGGGFYNDNYRASLPGRLFQLYLAKVLGKPVAISAHSFGPFQLPLYRLLARFVFNRVDLICTRDAHSLQVLNKLGVTAPHIEVTADSAWLLPSAGMERGMEILLTEGVSARRPLISLSVRKWGHYQQVDNIRGHERYVTVMAQTADCVVESLEANLVFVSTCTDLGSYPHDDRLVAEEIRTRMRYPERTITLRGDYSPEDLKAVYGQMDLHIGTRMHSNIMAASMGIPVVAIAYEFKTYDLMVSLGLDKYACDVEDLDSDMLQAKIVSALKHRDEMQRRIRANFPVLKRLARLNAQLIADLLE